MATESPDLPTSAPEGDEELGPASPVDPVGDAVRSVLPAFAALSWRAPAMIGRLAAEAIASWLSRLPHPVHRRAADASTSATRMARRPRVLVVAPRDTRRHPYGANPPRCSIVLMSLPPTGPITNRNVLLSGERTQFSFRSCARRRAVRKPLFVPPLRIPNRGCRRCRHPSSVATHVLASCMSSAADDTPRVPTRRPGFLEASGSATKLANQVRRQLCAGHFPALRFGFPTAVDASSPSLASSVTVKDSSSATSARRRRSAASMGRRCCASWALRVLVT